MATPVDNRPISLRWAQWWNRPQDKWWDWAEQRGLPNRLIEALPPDWLIYLPCLVLRRHVPIPDRSGLPDHDFCATCRTPTPGRAHRG